jgi:hypothetical protein
MRANEFPQGIEIRAISDQLPVKKLHANAALGKHCGAPAENGPISNTGTAKGKQHGEMPFWLVLLVAQEFSREIAEFATAQ